MEFFEKDLEEIIYNADKDALYERGLHMFGTLKKQLKIGNYGIADLIQITKPSYCKYFKTHYKGEINIVELKNNKIGVSTFFQALKYLKGVRTYLKLRGLEDIFDYRITLIGREIDSSSSFCYLGDLLFADLSESHMITEPRTSVDLYQYSYGVEGLKFKTVTGYNLLNTGF